MKTSFSIDGIKWSFEGELPSSVTEAVDAICKTITVELPAVVAAVKKAIAEDATQK